MYNLDHAVRCHVWFFTIVFRCLHRVKAAKRIGSRKLRWPRSNISPRLAVQLDQPQKQIRDFAVPPSPQSPLPLWLSMSAPAKRETPRNLLAADDSGISRLNTVAACGYSPPANCREQPGSPIREKSDGKSRSAQLRVKLGAREMKPRLGYSSVVIRAERKSRHADRADSQR